jgi:uncharacterized tellurite resistance protein B-like protein
MLDLIKKTLGLGSTGGGSRSSTQNSTALLASVILLGAAQADFEGTAEELDHVVQTISTTYDLSSEEVEELLEFARKARREAPDLQYFTHQINNRMSREEKRELVEDVWRIIYADGVVDKYEEHFVRKISNLLWLDHRDFIDAKLKAKAEAGK